MTSMRWMTSWTVAVTALVGCSNPSLPFSPQSDLASHLTLGPSLGELNLAKRKDQDWTGHTIVSRYLTEQRQKNAAGARYGLKAFGSSTWTQPFTVSSAGSITNTPAFSPYDPAYGNTLTADDHLFVMTNKAKGATNFYNLNPVTGATNSSLDALTLVGAPAGAQVDGSSLTVSNRGTYAMFLTTGGYFGCINTRTNTKVAGIALGTGQSAINSAPWIDYSMNADTEGSESVWCATTNATATVGTLYHITSGATWTSTAISVSGPAADGTGSSVTAAGFKTSPVAWNGKVYIGDVNGRLWEYTVATNKSVYYDLSPFSGIATDQILSPVAIDLGAGDQVSKVFVSCGNRVFWIDPASDVTNASPILLVDTATSTPGNQLQGSVGNVTFSNTTVLPKIFASDSVSVANGVKDTLYNQEITGSDGLNSPNDGNPCNGFVMVTVGALAFGGKLPISATLTMCTDPYSIPNATDAGSIYRASKWLGNGSGADVVGTLWTYSNVSASTQPRLLVSTPFSSQTGPSAQYTPITWNISGAIPNDNATYAFCLRGKNKQYVSSTGNLLTSAGYYGATASHTVKSNAAWAPYITVTASNYAMAGAIKSQPIIYDDGTNQNIYTVSANAFWEIDYSSAGNFSNPARTYFSLTSAGRGGAGNQGVVTALGNFVQNQIACAISMTGTSYYAYVVDEGGALYKPYVCKYSLPLSHATNADSLLASYALPTGSVHTCPFIPYDYFGGSLYVSDLGASTSTLYRLAQ